MRKNLSVVLAGGLGNQLFQIACALSLTDNEVRAITCLCNPRTSNDLADSQYLVFPSRVKFYNCTKRHILAKKIGLLLLSMTQRRNYLNRFFLLRHLVYLTCSVILTLHFRQFLYPRVGNGLGFDKSLLSKKGNLIVGYFQSYLYLTISKRKEEFMTIRLVEESEDFLKLKETLALGSPTFIHVRLGDYKHEKGFGVLSKDYFIDALSLIKQTSGEPPIKVFSDENELAFNLLSELPIKESDLVNTRSLLPAETLELMREFDKYVISNSTFSWWGAFLTRSPEAQVAYPNPWFEEGAPPDFLTPQNWLKVRRH